MINFILCDKLCTELDPCVISVTLHNEHLSPGEMQLSFVLECYDWEQYSFDAYNTGLLAKKYFEITCTHCIESSLTVGGFSDMSIHNEHPLLFKYSPPLVQLYFSSVPNNPYEVLGRLYEAHQKIYQDWRPLSDCINNNLIEVLHCGYGLLAQGPNIIMEAYNSAVSELLTLKAIESNFSKKNQLLLLSSGYIICSEIFIKKL